MSSANVRRFDVDEMAQRALWFDASQLDAMFRQEVVPSRGINKFERADIRNRIRKRIHELRKVAQRPATKPRRAASHNYPADADIPPPFNRRELLAGIREIEEEVRRTDRTRGEYSGFPLGVDFSPAATWLLNQLGKPSCLLSIWCAPSEKLCQKCEWLYRLYSAAGRREAQGSMLELQRELKLISV